MLINYCYPTMDKDLLLHKINKISAKLDAYYQTIERNNVDIPDFMKSTEHQRKNRIKADINRLLREGTLDYYYFKLLEEEDGIRR